LARKRRERMTLPKKKDDIEKIVREVEESHAHDHHHHHHHHHHGELDELLAVLELLIDSMKASIDTLDARVSRNSYEIARLYKILGHLVAYLARGEDARKHLEEAIRLLASEAKVSAPAH